MVMYSTLLDHLSNKQKREKKEKIYNRCASFQNVVKAR